VNDELFFIRSKYLLGSDVPSEETRRCVRWDKGLPGGNMKRSAQELQRWERLREARETLLGTDHPNTVWSIICKAWACISAGEPDRAEALFRKALETAQEMNGRDNTHTLLIQYGMAWASTDAGKVGPGAKLFEEILDIQRQTVEPMRGRDMLATRSALSRNHLFWRPHQLTIPILESILKEQESALGSDHLETLETLSLLACGYLLHRDAAASERAGGLLSRAFSSDKRLFGIEHPILLTLCGLSWTYARLEQVREATRIFGEVENAQRRLLGAEYPTTISSLESLGIKLNRGQISWIQKVTAPSFHRPGNNRYGATGALKCTACRARKIKVHENSLHLLTVVRIHGRIDAVQILRSTRSGMW